MYLVKFRACLSRALEMVRTYVKSTFETAAAAASAPQHGYVVVRELLFGFLVKISVKIPFQENRALEFFSEPKSVKTHCRAGHLGFAVLRCASKSCIQGNLAIKINYLFLGQVQ